VSQKGRKLDGQKSFLRCVKLKNIEMLNSELKLERLHLAWRKKLSLDHLFLENVADDRKPSFKMQYIVLCKKSSLT
jgi:hypothetical protein